MIEELVYPMHAKQVILNVSVGESVGAFVAALSLNMFFVINNYSLVPLKIFRSVDALPAGWYGDLKNGDGSEVPYYTDYWNLYISSWTPD